MESKKNKKFYWIKLKDTFMTSDAVDFLMGQKNGSQYVVLYQMLCLKTVNTNGRLVREIGEIIIPYEVPKIVRDCKYFDTDTVTVALELYKKLGLIYADENGILSIANYDNLVGGETQQAAIMRSIRARKNVSISSNNVTKMLPNCYCNVTQEKEKDIQDEEDNNNQYKSNVDNSNVDKHDLDKIKILFNIIKNEEDLKEFNNENGIKACHMICDILEKDQIRKLSASQIKELITKFYHSKLADKPKYYLYRCYENITQKCGGAK
jgi:hypothetical protein